MLRLMHYVVGDPSGLPPWPESWGSPPSDRLGDARFSVLYSGIGDRFYPSCRIGDGPTSQPGWVEQRQDTRTWTIQPGPTDNEGEWEWLGRSGTTALEEEIGRRFREDLPRLGDERKTRVAVLPMSAVEYQIFRWEEFFAEGQRSLEAGEAGKGDISPRFGCRFPPGADGRTPFFLYSLVAEHPDKPKTLEIMHAQMPVPWAAVRAAAVHHGADKVKMWSDYTGWDKEEGGVTVERNDDCPSLASYGLGEVEWVFNDK